MPMAIAMELENKSHQRTSSRSSRIIIDIDSNYEEMPALMHDLTKTAILTVAGTEDKKLVKKIEPNLRPKIESCLDSDNIDDRLVFEALKVLAAKRKYSNPFESAREIIGPEATAQIAQMVSSSITETIRQKEKEADLKRKENEERDRELEKSYRNTKVAALSNIATAIVTGTVTFLIAFFSKD